MKTSCQGVSLIQHFEGCQLKSYRCSGNVLTIGYGHTSAVQEDQEITQEQADALLGIDLLWFERSVNRQVKVPLEQHQFDALVSWTFNLGAGNLRASTLLRVLNAGDYKKVPEQIVRWDKADGKTLAGLTRRRRAEAVLFEFGVLDFGESEHG